MVESTVPMGQGGSSKPPGEVVAAICLLAGNQVFGWLAVPFAWDYLTAPQGPAGFILSLAFGAALSIFLFFKVYQGRNWARILWLVSVLVVSAMSLTDYALEFVRNAPLVVYVQFVAAMALNAVVVWLLFFSEGRAWFSRRAIGARH